MNIILLNVIQI